VHNCQRAFQSVLERRLQPFGVTPSHWYHLNELWSEDGLTQVELSGRLAIEKASSTRILEDLAARGLIERRRLTDDRRKIANCLTPKGRKLTARLIDETVALTAQSQRGLAADDMRVFLKVLGTLTTNLRGMAGQSDGSRPSAPSS
jgi:MarR family transcriptional regulator, organic hydroperoxide resistance regulator